jgi:hypothetical protein
MPHATCSLWKMAFALVPLALKTMNAPKNNLHQGTTTTCSYFCN